MNKNIFKSAINAIRISNKLKSSVNIFRAISACPLIYSNEHFKSPPIIIQHRSFSSPKIDELGTALIDLVGFESVCSDSLESLCEYFEELVEKSKHLQSSDVTLGDGVLNVNFGKPYGTYVINRQTPNRQIWLSSPTSGPKRYDFIRTSKDDTTSKLDGYWYYKHDNTTLHELLQKEIKEIVKSDVDFFSLPHGIRNRK